MLDSEWLEKYSRALCVAVMRITVRSAWEPARRIQPELAELHVLDLGQR